MDIGLYLIHARDVPTSQKRKNKRKNYIFNTYLIKTNLISVLCFLNIDFFSFKNRFKITNESDTEGFSPYLVLKQYLESLHTHLTNLPGDFPLFVRGDPAKVVKGKQEPTKWKRSPIGEDTLAKIPRFIANFLKLPQPEEYTSHSFRRSSATLAAEGGAERGAMCVSEFVFEFFRNTYLSNQCSQAKFVIIYILSILGSLQMGEG